MLGSGRKIVEYFVYHVQPAIGDLRYLLHAYYTLPRRRSYHFASVRRGNLLVVALTTTFTMHPSHVRSSCRVWTEAVPVKTVVTG